MNFLIEWTMVNEFHSLRKNFHGKFHLLEMEFPQNGFVRFLGRKDEFLG
jgi:hypothetical protein